MASIALLLALSSTALAQLTGKTSAGGLSVDAPQTNPTTCDPTTVTYTYTGNSSWTVAIGLTNVLVDQSPLSPATGTVFGVIATGLPATSTPASVNWTTVNVPSGYYIITAEATSPEGSYVTTAPKPVDAASDRFQVVNGTSTACLFPSQPAAPAAPNHTGAIVGGVIGGLALLALIVLAACCLKKRNKNKKAARKEKFAGAIPIADHKSVHSTHKDEKLAAAAGAGVLAESVNRDSKFHEGNSTAYDGGSTRAGSMHTIDGVPTLAAVHIPHDEHHIGAHEDPFQDPRFTGDFGPSQRSSTLEPEHAGNIDGVLATANSNGSNGTIKSARKPAPEYDGTDEGHVVSEQPQQHYLIPDQPARF